MRRQYLSNFSSPAPRYVPLSVRLKVLFGGFSNQFGWIFFGFGMIFVWIFALQSDFTSFILFRFPTRDVVGIVEDVRTTNASEDDYWIYEISYQYFDNAGSQHQGISYSTDYPSEGARVEVEYLSSNPSISRIAGMRRAIFGPMTGFVIIFPLIGIGFLYSGIRYGIKANHLLSGGNITYGKLISAEGTGASINNQPVLKLTFSFVSEAGLDWEVIAKTHEPADLRDEDEEPILYDPEDPSYAVLLDNLPGETKFDASGNLIPASLFETTKVMFVPILSIIGHSTYICLTLLEVI